MFRMEVTCKLLLILAFCLGLESAQDLDYPLTVEYSKIISQGDEVSASCNLGQGRTIPGMGCQWTMPDKSILNANLTSGEVTDAVTNELVNGLTAFGGAENTVCGLRIQSVDENVHNGPWTCIIEGAGADDAFHRGTFHYLTTEEGYVKDVRIPRHAVPSNYEVSLTPIIEEGDFTIIGQMSMTFSYEEAGDSTLANQLILHSKETSIKETEMNVMVNNQAIAIVGHEYYIDKEFYIIHLAEDMPANATGVLSLNFTSRLNDVLVGFYRSSYTDVDTDELKYLGVTQFQYTDARRAFPCLDEPDIKATFTISLGRKKGMTSRSNMPSMEIGDIDGMPDYEMEYFETSVPMSTYLVAFLISDFSSTDGVDVLDGDEFKIWHIGSKASQAALAADSGPRILNFLADYYNVSYPLNKTDMAALPDFLYGAMENWGLITYRETALLYEEGVSSSQDYERVLQVVAHELAHMWFGNLVTMKWWNDLWLNEGFASYVENLGMDFYDRNLQTMDRMVYFQLQSVFELDSLESSLPISVDVGNPDYDMTFSSLSYDKGSCIIRMLENFITTETFNKGITNYLNHYAYSNAQRDDLWTFLDDAAKEDNNLDADLTVSQIMETWTAQPGYPVVTVTQNAENALTLEQKRFFINPTALDQNATTYYIPLTVTYPGQTFTETQAQEWLKGDQNNRTLAISSAPYVMNVQETGYYRVNYDMKNWQGLSDVLMTSPIDINRLNRAQILDDSFNIARAGQLNYTVPLTIMNYLKNESDYIPTASAFRALSYLDLMIRRNSEDYEIFKANIIDLFNEHYDKLTFEITENDEFMDIKYKRLLFNWMCKYGYESCVESASQNFNSWQASDNPNTDNPIHPDLKNVVYDLGIQTGNSSTWEFLFDRFSETEVAAERRTIIYALGETQDPTLIRMYLSLSINPNSGIRKQDTVYVYRAVGATLVGRREQFDWLQREFAQIYDYFRDGLPRYVDDMLSGFMDDACTQEEIDELTNFLDEKQEYLGSAIAYIKQGIDNARTNQLWVENNYDAIMSWFRSNTSNSTTTTTTATTSSGTSVFVSMFIMLIPLIILKCYAYTV